MKLRSFRIRTRTLAAGALCLLSALPLVLPQAVKADTSTVSYTSTFTGSGTQNGPVIQTSGQNNCVVTTSGGATGYTVTIKGNNVIPDNRSYSTLTQFTSGGVVTTDSVNTGSLTGTVFALGNFTYVVTGTITGTLKVIETCSGAGATPGTIITNQGTSPWVVTTPSPSFQDSTGPVRSITCNQRALIAITSATTTLAIAAVNGKVPYVCYAQQYGTGTNTTMLINFEYGTQATTPCDTGTTAIDFAHTGVAGINASANLYNFSGVGLPFGPTSNQVCIVTAGAAVNVDVAIWYSVI